MRDATATIHRIWIDYGGTTIITLLAIAAILVNVAIYRAARRRRNRQDEPGGTTTTDRLSAAVTFMILVLSAEGMYVVLTTKLSRPIPPHFAVFVCAVVEGLLVVLFRRAAEFNDRRGTPGPFGRAFWIVAAAGGCVVAMSTTSVVEMTLRLLLPLSVALLHWIKLTADNAKVQGKVTWNWTPTKIMIRLGIGTPGETTLTQESRQRRQDRLVRAAYTVSSARFFKTRKLRKLRVMMLDADADMADAIDKQLALAYTIEARITRVVTEGAAAVTAAKAEKSADDNHGAPEIGSSPTDHQVIEGVPVKPTNGHHIPLPTTIPVLRIEPAMSPAERDRMIILKYWEDLMVLLTNGSLCRSSIERVCTTGDDKVLARQANRILAIVPRVVGLDLADDVPLADRIDQAIMEVRAAN
jgi:heme/copper-type cytochrome/quinol oxidase subunit 2